jgi:hypothetical protein
MSVFLSLVLLSLPYVIALVIEMIDVTNSSRSTAKYTHLLIGPVTTDESGDKISAKIPSSTSAYKSTTEITAITTE